ncbi:hypothetical protein SAMN05443575_3845 [Jatrophihabitans endophyticus]|uniref:Neocarzinostatin family protein n=1 Tax=Jatrophihabitans endophyticus TaxID=1206085 RepID=A0A1M5SWN4_9ACTN|nr:hypothetical protein [Jatrophihabitans endophyticus]SHH42895.1 hypothetical protein SAMN05443575_3845 [Jatrophihabitans endophyticus]
MTRSTRPATGRTARRLRRLGATGAVIAALWLLFPALAAADTSSATARAATVGVAGAAAVDSGQAAAANDGSGGEGDQGGEYRLSVLGSQSLVTSGVLAQHAIAYRNGSSAACAGLVGSGGSLTVESDRSCTVRAGTSGGIVIALTPLVKIRADAIVASCTATSDGRTSARAQLLNAAVYTTVGLVTTHVDLAAAPGVGTSVSVPAVATLGLNAQTQPKGPGSIAADALTVSLLSGTAQATVASVTCGPNALVLPTPALPVPGLLFAAPLLAVAGWLGARRWRRTVAGTAT